MLDKYLIVPSGFHNLVDGDGRVTGFQLRIRITYYRGIFLPLLTEISLTIDGERVQGDKIRFSVGGHTVPYDEMWKADDVHWPFGEPATLIVDKPGGLKPGLHDVEVGLRINPSYMPPKGFFGSDRKKLTLVGSVLQKAGSPADASNGHVIRRGVSLYSYQEAYYTRAMTLEDCLAEVASIGAQGVQVIAQQMIPNYPDPPAEWVGHWHGVMDEYGLTPTSLDTMVDLNWGAGKHPAMSQEEAVDTLAYQLELAARLGFSVLRPSLGLVVKPDPEIVEAAIPHAEKHDVKIALEIHAPIPLDGEWMSTYMELIEKTGTGHLGFTLDAGIFCKRLPRVLKDNMLRRGAQEHIVEYVDQAFIDGMTEADRLENVRKMGGNAMDELCAWFSRAYGPYSNSPEQLREILPYTYNIHAKFYEMTENLEEYCIPYEDIYRVLLDERWGGGSLDSEFEGQRWTQDAFNTNEVEEVRRQHAMFRRLQGEI